MEESGDFRRGEEGVFNGEQCIFMAPPAQYVPQLMNELFGWMREAQTKVHPLVLSSVFHYEFVFIHPFSDDHVIIRTKLEKPSKINGLALI